VDDDDGDGMMRWERGSIAADTKTTTESNTESEPESESESEIRI